MTKYLHGTEFKIKDSRPGSVALEGTTATLLICTAPVHLASGQVNKLLVITSPADVAGKLGPDLPGFTGASAAMSILDEGPGLIVAVNVLDPATHKTATPDEAVTLGEDGTATLAHKALVSAVVKNQAKSTTYVEGTDYLLDKALAKITRLSAGAIAAGATLSVASEWADPSKVQAADVLGAVSASGVRTGLQLVADVPALDLWPAVLLAPGFSELPTVAAEMVAKAERFGAAALLDAPVGTTFQQALASRMAGSGASFAASSNAAILCYPRVQVTDPLTGGLRLVPYSQVLAGVMARTDMAKGVWESPSNWPLRTVLGLETALSFAADDSTCETNLLNAKGITTVRSGYGQGYHSWGGRNASFPAETHPRSFINVQRFEKATGRALVRFGLKWNDRNLTTPRMDALCEAGNAYLADAVARGAAVKGSKVLWDASSNPATELAQGHGTFRLHWAITTPLERITFESDFDIDLYNNLSSEVTA